MFALYYKGHEVFRSETIMDVFDVLVLGYGDWSMREIQAYGFTIERVKGKENAI